MPRLQILELPEGSTDDRPPFVLVIDEAPRHGPLFRSFDEDLEMNDRVADRVGARSVLVCEDTIEIPANEVTAEFREGMQAHVAEMYETARQSLSESETLGHKLLQRAENAEGRSRAMEVQRDRANRRAEEAEAGRVAADNMLRAVCEVFGGPHQDPVVKARETLARAEEAEAKLETLTAQTRRRDTERMDAITDALGIDRLRDWDEITEALARRHKLGGRMRGD